MAAVSPRFRASPRNTVLSTVRADGFRPNEMLERPRTMPQLGKCLAIFSMPSSVCLAVCNNRELVIVAARVEPDALAALAVRELDKRKLAGL